ncbi:ankyrin repeat domain-containing protein [bacterium]|nr:ankyrin repeat domain-containing protein [bacterium]
MVLAVCLMLLVGACVDQHSQSPTTAVDKSDSGTPSLDAPVIDYPTGHKQSWVTSQQPQPPSNPAAVEELAKLGWEFTGKRYIEAAIAGDTAAVQLFLDAGMFVDTRSLGGQSALMGAAATGQRETARLLIEHGADLELREARSSELTPLLYAVMNDQADMVAYLLEQGADPDAFNSHLETPLFIAATRQSEQIVRLLMEHGASVKLANIRHTTPLIYAAGYPNLEIVKLLVEHGADVNATDSSGSTPVLVAAGFGKLENLRYLLEHGASCDGQLELGFDVIHLACRAGSTAILDLVWQPTLDINRPDSLTAKTPLLLALENRQLEAAHWCLDHQADPRRVCVFGYSALDLAEWLNTDAQNYNEAERAEQGLPDPVAVTRLVERMREAAAACAATGGPAAEITTGDSVNATAGNGELSDNNNHMRPHLAVELPLSHELTAESRATAAALSRDELAGLSKTAARDKLSELAIQYSIERCVEAAAGGDHNVLVLFLAAGLDPNAETRQGVTALSAACWAGDAEAARILLAAGAPPDGTFGQNKTPVIQLAIFSGNPEVVELLTSRGISLDAPDATGKTALMEAAQQGQAELVRSLLDAGAKVNVVDGDGRSALHRAIVSGSLETTQAIVEGGADLELADLTAGITPLAVAVMFSSDDLVAYLLSQGADANRRIASSGASLLHLACISGNIKIVDLLLDQGLSINATDDLRHSTPLVAAIENLDADPAFIKALLERGADVNAAETDFGYSPLLLAARLGHFEICQLLIAHDADLAYTTQDGSTVLHAAVASDNAQLVAFLLSLPVDLWATDKEGRTALDRAEEYNCNQVLPLLRKAQDLPTE